MEIFNLSEEHDCLWVTFGQESKDGHPHHPLYLRQDSVMKEFDIEKYIDRKRSPTRKPTSYSLNSRKETAPRIVKNYCKG